MDFHISKLAEIVNSNLDSKIKNHLSGAFSSASTIDELIEELKKILAEAKTELEDIKRIKLVFLSDIMSAYNSETEVLHSSNLLKEVEKQREQFLERLKQKEKMWLLEEERIEKERIEYEISISK